MKKIFAMCVLGVLVARNSAEAANIAVITSPPTLLKLVVFGIAIGCLVFSLKVVSVLKGGLLSRAWQVFMIGFGVLALGQLAALMGDMEFFNLPSFVTPALWAVTTGLFFYGVFETKRTLE